MDVKDILQPNSVVSELKVNSKKRLMAELAKLGAKVLGTPCAELHAALQEREDLGSTATGFGVAIPHARIDGIDKVVGAFVRLEEPIDFGATDRQGVDLVFVLFAPTSSSAQHLKALARVSRVLRSEDVRNKLRSTKDAEAIYSVLIEVDQSIAA